MFWSPFALINLLFFLNIDVGFYLIGLFQKSFWLIDPYWSILPFVYGLIYITHPLAIFSTRSMTSLILVFIWGVRLTHSYFRREGWKFGEREDWRYTKMAKDFDTITLDLTKSLWCPMGALVLGSKKDM